MIDIKLYEVSAIVPVFRACKDVEIFYFLQTRKEDALYAGRYAELIEDYKDCKDKVYAEGQIDELFTPEQAKQFMGWHKTRWPGVAIIAKEVDLPIPFDSFPMGALSFGGLEDRIYLYNDREYELPFKVVGYYDLGDYEEATGASSGTDKMDEQVDSAMSRFMPTITKAINQLMDEGKLKGKTGEIF